MEQNTRPSDGLRFGCPGCGSGLRYDIAAGRMHCDSCGNQYDLAEIADPSRDAADGLMDAAEYRCPQCGAAVHTTQTSVTSFCSYCGADVILTQRLTRITRPQQVVPFRVTREQCEEIYRRRVREAKYAPDDFGDTETIGHFRPVYIPFWRYRGRAEGQNLSGTCVHRHSDARYDYTDRYGYSVSGDVTASGVIYDASVSFEDETAQHLRFATERAVSFHPAYLCGFYAESPDTKPSLYAEALKDYAKKAWEQEFDDQSEYSESKVDFPAEFTSSADLVLMPVWLLAHRSEGRVVYTAVNGDTGEIVCDTPISSRRFGMLAAELTGLILAVLLLLQFAFILRPRLLAALCGLTAAVAQWVIARVARDLRARTAHENDYTWLTANAKSTEKQKKKAMKARSGGTLWYLPLLVTGGVTAVGMIFGRMSAYNANAFMASLLSDHAWLPYVVQLCALVFFVLSIPPASEQMDSVLYYIRLGVMGLTLIALFVMTADMGFYLCCIALLALTALAMLRINRVHNAYVSRPVPFFGKEGEQP